MKIPLAAWKVQDSCGWPFEPFKEDDYLDGFTIHFHHDSRFRKKWQNGEHAWLDFNTGKARTF